ncbi:MAG: hypothetical protein J6X36_10320 [Lachnospiraceae bacterium]|nr:hypothetical protein [Lachnospiraceae bacterium]
MKRIIREVLFELNNHKLISIMLGVQISLFIICSEIMLFMRNTELAPVKEKIDDYGNIGCYSIFDNLVGEAETEFLSNSDACLILKEFEAELKRKKEYGYCEIYSNPLLLFSDKIPETALSQYEYGNKANDIGMVDGQIACQIKNIFLDNETVDSFIFNESAYSTVIDCLYSDELRTNINPIVLGYDYKDNYEIGETLGIITPFSDKKEYTVTGFFEKGDNILCKGRFVNLDRYVLTLFPEGKEIVDSEEENFNQIRLYLMKINGQFITTSSPTDVQNYVNSLCLELNIIPASTVSNSGNSQLTITKAAMEKIMISITDISVLTGIFSLITVLLFVTLRISSNKRYYTILYINGYSISELLLIQVISFAFILLAADIVGYLAMYAISKIGFPCRLDGIYIFLVDLTIMVIVTFSSYIAVKRKNIADSLRGINDHSI